MLAKVFYKPYFYVLVKEERYIQDCIQCIRRRFEDSAVEVTVVDKEDLDMPNHLSGKLRRYSTGSQLGVTAVVVVLWCDLCVVSGEGCYQGYDATINMLLAVVVACSCNCC